MTMLVLATSDKGGTGRSVTSSNLVYRSALAGQDVCYLDFDFGSPTAGAIFGAADVERGVARGGLHSYLRGRSPEPMRVNVWEASERLRRGGRPLTAGRLQLVPGDRGGAEFAATPAIVQRCVELLVRMEEEFALTLIDLSAGRSYATDIMLAALASRELRGVTARWLVFHRWTSQHIIAASGLVHGEKGIIEMGEKRGHRREALVESIRFVRTAVVDPSSESLSGLRPPQLVWLQRHNKELKRLASESRVGEVNVIGSVPLDPVLQWQEQLISDDDTVTKEIANEDTVAAFKEIARKLVDEAYWTGS
ncbi:DNA-binding protein [Catellatospora sp. TT07R-123]|uniref:SCO2523 family variant P-loop protein n=1 Tax=Catellatospora sp. TT07R-123 TaxID=2733863 RepID=UPI001B2C2831|nr:SCO2523 family variant P-loop protein [Catellatospora sp. TT07R-123]GHJ45826.1 DNA-binding protein [Catellatospora sp. TT07R-123]